MTRANYRSLPRHQGGFSLIDVLLALGVVILISGITLSGIRRTNESNQAKAVGEQIKMVGTALNTYISLRYDALYAHVPGTDDVGDPGTAADPGPRTCVCQVGTGACSATGNIKMCTITSETLRRNGLLPNNFSGYNAFGSTYQYRIRIEGTGSTPNVDGMVWTDDAYTMEGEERFDLLGQAMMVAGADSGMTRSTLTRVEGFNGAWAEENMGVNKLGVLAYRAGYKTFGYAAYLRLSGTGPDAPMTGDIDMGNNDLYNIQTVKTQTLGVDDYIQIKQDGDGIVFSGAGSFDATTDAALPGKAVADPSISAAANGLVLKSDTTIQVRNAANTANADISMGDLTSENITASGTAAVNTLTASNTGNSIVAQGSIVSGGRIRAQSGFLAGTTTAALNKTLVFSGSGAGVGDAGGIYFNVDGSGVSGTPMGFKLDSSTAILHAANIGITADGNIRSASDVVADDRVVVGGSEIVLDSTSNPTIGSACAAGNAGHVRRAATVGELVQCINDGGAYRWRTMGSSIVQQAGGTACTGAGSAMGAPVDINCPAGYLVVTGGYSWASGALRATAAVNTRLDINTWRVQAGATAAYLGTETVATCFNTYAICSR